ncbi:MAG: sigma-54 dependent transcriptional regulator [Bacteroidia bacterium]
MTKILIIEDDLDMSQLLKKFLTKHGYEVELAQNGRKGIAAFSASQPNLILCDYRLGDMDGTEVLNKIKDIEPTIPFIIMTGYSDIRTAVNVMKLGAYDYLAKPLLPDETLQLIRRALENKPQSVRILDHENPDDANPASQSPVKIKSVSGKNDFVYGKSEVSKELLRQIELVAPTNYSVIIYGESGAGKEAIAQTIHKKSKRARQPFVAMDCGAMSKELAGSELFGHEKGSFTGALGTKIGHFELANGGTIFLDEVANLPYDVQSSLLRTVQERRIKRIGGLKEIPIDVRIIVASNENLLEAHRKGKFREDLYHRFNEFHLTVPALRERRDDIMMYAKYFLKIANEELEKNIEGFAPGIDKQILNYPWYGNLREMKNVVRRAVLLSVGNLVEAQSLPFEISNFSRTTMAIPPETNETSTSVPQSEIAVPAPVKEEKTNLKSAALEAEYDLILKVLKEVNFNKSKAAKILNIDRKTLYNKMRAFKLEA